MKIDKVFDVESELDGYISAAETRKVTDLLESSIIFEKEITRIREKYKIPKDSYGTDNKVIPCQGSEAKYVVFQTECESLAYKLNLPDYWGESISAFALYGGFIAPRRRPVLLIYNPHDIYPGSYISDHWFDLVISEKISKSEFMHEVEKNWPMIEKTISTLPHPQKHKMIRAIWAKRITGLRENEHKSFKEIADILEDENKGSENEDLINEDYVKILYHRWKKKQKATK